MTNDKREESGNVVLPEGVTENQMMAELRATPFLRHGVISNALASMTIKTEGLTASGDDLGTVLREMADKVAAGDLRPVTNTLLAQGVMLDVTATELMRRAWQNVGDHPETFQRYMNLALKTQAHSRTALEALARMHQPREQVVRHVHVYEGGQAVVAEQLHMHGPGVRNAGTDDQCHAARAGGAGERAALPSANPLGDTVPIASGARPEAVQDARRNQPRRSGRQRQRAKARAADGGDGAAS